MWREHFRHRIASYNEESGRYKVLEPTFYVPASRAQARPGGQAGLLRVRRRHAPSSTQIVRAETEPACRAAYAAYEAMLAAGVAREVARIVLPVTIYSSAYVTMNARAMMNFLSLRHHSDEGSRFPSFPQREIEMVAERYEAGVGPAHAADPRRLRRQRPRRPRRPRRVGSSRDCDLHA